MGWISDVRPVYDIWTRGQHNGQSLWQPSRHGNGVPHLRNQRLCVLLRSQPGPHVRDLFPPVRHRRVYDHQSHYDHSPGVLRQVHDNGRRDHDSGEQCWNPHNGAPLTGAN